MQITGQIQFCDANKFGYGYDLKVNGVKYGCDTKGGKLPDGVTKGSSVTFESFSTDYNGKTYAKYKLQTLKLAAGGTVSTAAGVKGTGFSAGSGSRDTYWADKAQTDAVKEPRIAYWAALERSIQFTDLAIKNNALPLPKIDKNKLEVIQAFVDEQTQRFISESYNQRVPSAVEVVESEEPNEGAPEEVVETSEEWS